MANDADIFMILLRPTRVPVMGEAVSHLFQGQILIESLTWNLHNEDERKNAKNESANYSKAKKDQDQAASKELRKEILAEDRQSAQQKQEKDRLSTLDDIESKRTKASFDFQKARASSKHAADLERSYTDEMSRLNKELRKRLQDIDQRKLPGDPDSERSKERKDKEALADELDRNPNFEITFSKRVDIASTQLLNSMKAGDVFPSGTLTIHKRSATAMDGTSLVFTIQKIRLLDYKLQVVVGDTMTEMMEQWTCEFGALAYVYKNPPSHYAHNNAVQAGAKGMTQGTMRAFTMKNIGSPI